MASKFEPVVIYGNNKVVLRFKIKDLDADPTGETPLDLNDFNLRWALSKHFPGGYSATATLLKTPTKIAPFSDGIAEVKLLSADVAALEGRFHQELEAIDLADNEPVVVGAGDVSFKRNVANS